jgi:UDP-3-O-[3-hydroxymyristoyl] N-acetylglucosamine deacetylase
MSALYGLGIDNAYVEVEGSEVPILDGSAMPIVELLHSAGIEKLNKARKYLKFKKKIRIEKDGKWIEIIPSRFFKTTFHIAFDNEIINEQKAYFKVTPAIFHKEIAKARTFGFKKDIEAIWKMGLAKGGSLENAVVIDNDKVLNPEGLRYSDEFVRHKVLDLIGDLSLIGYRFFGHVRASKSGHQLNNLFAKALLESNNYYSVIELNEEENKFGSSDLVLEPHGI